MVIIRLYLSDRTSRSKYLIDTGADVSVIPLTTASQHLPPAFLQLFAANGTVISTYGQQLVTLDLGLRRVFKWPFIIAAVSQPIIGADFLRHYGLLVDIRHGRLVDSLTKLQAQGTVQQGNNSAIKAVNGNTKFHRLLAEFPSLFEAVSTSRKLKHEGAKKNDRTPISWSDDSAAAFEKCKKDLAEATVLYHPSADASLAIVVDASDTAGSENVVANALSRIHISTINTPSVVDFNKMAREQLKDSQLQDILAGSCPTSLVLQPLPVGQPPVTLHCDVSMDRIRPFVPKMFRREIFNNLHALSHPGCQRAKVSQHTRSENGKFELPSSRFEHVHIDLVGPLPPSEGFRYCLTCVDRFSKWPEAYPLVEISAEAVANTFYTGWISRFGPPLRLTTDQGKQFEASLFDALSKFLGTEKRHTTPYHPAANGQEERLHRQLKAAIMGHGNAQWTTVLPTILMGFQATWKKDLQATTAEMIYRAPIRLPGEFLCPSKPSADPVTFVVRLRETMQRLSPPTTQHHGHHTIFVSKDLATCSHVFLRTDSLKKGLQPPYEGPYKVVSRTEKVIRILRHGKEVSVNIDRLKPAYIPKELEDIPVEADVKKRVSLQPEEVPDSGHEKQRESSSRQETTTRSGRRVRFNPKYS
ncbi:transposon Ty3-I Gag-Pol polyprotein [Nephila pilipes]|uniref:Transposon Ty3-I Gag-Pol polyprotein n=1 Tax=Nephila pilipes TaxID=299642 RepID=A0A8X6MPF2_NEPPI|nr:transposon Ty3-I Gag-Pol polyprotein [Nephila pilipes]